MDHRDEIDNNHKAVDQAQSFQVTLLTSYPAGDVSYILLLFVSVLPFSILNYDDANKDKIYVQKNVLFLSFVGCTCGRERRQFCNSKCCTAVVQ